MSSKVQCSREKWEDSLLFAPLYYLVFGCERRGVVHFEHAAVLNLAL
jgi:hypothetical protein